MSTDTASTEDANKDENSRDPFQEMETHLVNLARDIEVTRRRSQQEMVDLKCPQCNTVHPYQTATATVHVDEAVDKEAFWKNLAFKVYPTSMEIACRCASAGDVPCQTKSAGFVLPCGHLVCDGHLLKSQSICAISDCYWNHIAAAVTTSRPSELLCSHGARVIILDEGGHNTPEECPICLETVSGQGSDQQLIVLVCGHTLCGTDFERMGGILGEEALLSPPEMKMKRMDDVQKKEKKFEDALDALFTAFRKNLRAEESPTVLGGKAATTLYFFSSVLGCHQRNRGCLSFVRRGGLKFTIDLMSQFPDDLDVQLYGAETLCCLLCDNHLPPTERTSNAETMAQHGILPKSIQFLTTYGKHQEDQLFRYIDVARNTCLLLLRITKCLGSDILFSKYLPELKELTKALMCLMTTFLASSALLSVCMDVMFQLSRNKVVKDIMYEFWATTGGANGAEACVSAIRAHPENLEVLKPAVGVLFNLAVYSDTVQMVVKVGSIDVVSHSILAFPMERELQVHCFRLVQRICMYCTGDDDVFRAFRKNSIVQKVCQQLPRLSEVPRLVRDCISTLVSLAETFPSLRLDIVQSGVLDSVADALLTHCKGVDEKFSTAIVSYLYALLCALLRDNPDQEIRLAFCTSSIVSAVKRGSDVIRSMVFPTLLVSALGLVSISKVNRMMNLASGFQNFSVMLGASEFFDPDLDYDFDDDVTDEAPLCPPPFDVRHLLQRNLLEDEQTRCFTEMLWRTDERSTKLSEDHGSSFLMTGVVPAEGQEVCIRVVLPFGGRGYLYGTVLKVHDPPTKEEYQANDSVDRLRGEESRDDLVQRYGAAHGQKVTVLVCLESRYFEPKKRYAPLPDFFMGQKTKYKALLVWSDNVESWVVTRLSLPSDTEE